jgi:DNA-binding NarL/FixJ family response regulator
VCCLSMPDYTALIIEDFKGFSQFVLSTLQQTARFQVIYQASDGLEGVQRAEELQPDLIVLDIGLPRLNGIEATRQIRKVSPNSKILFLTQESSAKVVELAMRLGGQGYVLKGNAASELTLAVEAVLRGERFVSPVLNSDEIANASRRHEIIFCSDEESLLSGLAVFLAAALKAGDAAIVWATESHREALRSMLCGQGVDVDSAIRSGTYISSDVSEPPDSERILSSIRGLSDAAFNAGKKHPRVAVCGERAGRLWTEGKLDAALHIEKLCNGLIESHDVDILCVYPLPQSQEEDSFRSLCAEHTAVCYR